jgi:hypothetical protein
MPEQSGRNENTDYERSDASLTGLLLVAIVLTVLLGVAPLIIRAGFPATRGDVDRRLNIAPPAPRLQTNPRADLDAYLDEQQSLLNSYGWVDRDKGIAREPVTMAIQRLARDGIDGFPKQAPQ